MDIKSLRTFSLPWTFNSGSEAFDFLADGDRVTTGEGVLEVVHTPGHAPDHVVLWHEESRTVFGADLLQVGNTVAIPASSGGDLPAYLRSLRRVQALRPSRVLPAHGPVIENPLALIEQYLAHRHHREVQVLSALEARLDTVDASRGAGEEVVGEMHVSYQFKPVGDDQREQRVARFQDALRRLANRMRRPPIDKD